MFAYRLLFSKSFLIKRSFCPHCSKSIYWYDLIPILSWFLLKGHCRFCAHPISWLYPFIEIFTALALSLLLITNDSQYWLSYGLFFSALIITMRTDLETMLICQVVTLYLVPVGLIISWFGLLPISPLNSFLGVLSASLFLGLISMIFLMCTGKKGMGEGDIELIALIGAFLGISGWWFSLLIGSLLGSIAGLATMMYTEFKKDTKIPFGAYLASGAILYTLSQSFF